MSVTNFHNPNFPESKVTPSDVLLCLNNSSNPQKLKFTLTKDKEKQEILTTERLEVKSLSFFAGKMT